MKRAVGIIMDPIGSINIKKDSSFAMMLAAQRRGWALWYLQPGDLFLRSSPGADGGLDGDPAPTSEVSARMQPVTVIDNSADYYRLGAAETRPLASLDLVLMRKDPPFDMEYIYCTYLLDLARAAGLLVVNDPQALRDANEKVFAAHFPQCCPPLLVTRSAALLRAFLAEHGDLVLKPLDGMGGRSIFRVRAGDPNTSVIIETLLGEVRDGQGARTCMAQRYLPEIADGDKRVLLIDGEPVPYCLARIPAVGESRGNLAAGARAEVRPLGERERWIAAQVAPALRARGILFAGLDVIGDWLTEVNITSPTCIREIDRDRGTDIAGDLMDALEARLDAR
ncbi:MAG: glutathione synthase [Chromatiaceae bacterium]|nr:MAG: glutathione synthase [Chromatiaceae bacterium]